MVRCSARSRDERTIWDFDARDCDGAGGIARDLSLAGRVRGLAATGCCGDRPNPPPIVAVDPDSLGIGGVIDAIDPALLTGGIEAVSIQDQLEENQRQSTGFLYLVEGFMALG